MVHNESFFLPIWLRYYSKFFAPEDIYVLDHETTDGSTSRSGFVRIPVTHPTVDHAWMVETIQAYQHELLARYEAVLVTDVDEIVAPDPAIGTLREYIGRFEGDFVNTHGREILHVREEAPYTPDRLILEQRRYWFESPLYNKPILARVPMEWVPGFHARTDLQERIDLDLYLVHLHRIDYERCLARHRQRAEMQWNSRDLAEDWAGYNRIIDEQEFQRWFYTDTNWDAIPIYLWQIPKRWEHMF